jgi:hypothetical protein
MQLNCSLMEDEMKGAKSDLGRAISLAFLVFVLCFQACGATATVTPSTDTINILTGLETQLLGQSADWQNLIKNAIGKLPQAESQIKNDLNDLVNHAIEAAGATGACLYDKIHTSLANDVAGILAKFQNQPAPVAQPRERRDPTK